MSNIVFLLYFGNSCCIEMFSLLSLAKSSLLCQQLTRNNQSMEVSSGVDVREEELSVEGEERRGEGCLLKIAGINSALEKRGGVIVGAVK